MKIIIYPNVVGYESDFPNGYNLILLFYHIPIYTLKFLRPVTILLSQSEIMPLHATLFIPFMFTGSYLIIKTIMYLRPLYYN